ncbi:MAG: helix-turn-helix domain-containing protein [Ruminococcaceae bacterium]|nr:helix-turn-helix domain-containing protein [Oscillospiraceae bacterium]
MDQVKIGKFIAECRKAQKLTQMQLAEKLGITDRAVSKWETGKSLPDSAIMLSLCSLLKITVNDLLSGEVVIMENYNKEMENKLLEMVRQKESDDKRMLALEIFIGVIFSVVMFVLIMVASFVQMTDWIRILLILLGFIPFVVAVPFMIKIEQTAGYYECQKCGHRYVPTFSSVLWAMHVNRTRYMKCPECHQKSWQKKVLGKYADQ